MRAAKKTNHSWIRGEPAFQPWFAYTAERTWQPLETEPKESNSRPVNAVTVLSWNIDQFRAFENERMTSSLRFLEDYVSKLPCKPVIMLNEMLSSDMEIIKLQPWIQDNYYLTDESHTFWESSRYGKSSSIRTLFSILGIGNKPWESV